MSAQRFYDRSEALHELACESCNLYDYGTAEYRDGLDILLRSIDEEPPISEIGSGAAEAEIVAVLKARLITQNGWNNHPNALSNSIERPVIILGLPRSGTTALHQLLSLDPRFQGIENWLTHTPCVRPPRDTWADNPWYRSTELMVEQMRTAAPEVGEAHLPAAHEVDECLTPLAQNFVSNRFPCFLHVPTYDYWFQHEGELSSYRRYADILKLVGHGDSRRWLLKNPSHLFGISALLKTFPDACVIQTHRDPASSIASLTSLIGGLRDMMTGSTVDRTPIQQREIAFWSEAARRGMSAQDREPHRFFNVFHRDLREDPLSVVRGIYRHFAIELDLEVEQSMRKWAEVQTQLAQNVRNYAAVSNVEKVRMAFDEYIGRYELSD